MLFVFFVSCVQPYVKINSNSLVQPAPTLLATAFVDTKAQEEEVELTDMIQSKDMDAVGFHLITRVPVWGSLGFCFPVTVSKSSVSTMHSIIPLLIPLAAALIFMCPETQEK